MSVEYVTDKNTADYDSLYKDLALSAKQEQCIKLGSKLYYCSNDFEPTFISLVLICRVLPDPK